MPARSVCLVTLSPPHPKLDPDASAARYPSQTSTIPYHTSWCCHMHTLCYMRPPHGGVAILREHIPVCGHMFPHL